MNIMDLDMNEIRAVKYTASTILPYKGSWNAEWDGRDDNGLLVPSGEYIYTLHVDGALKVGKVVVVRK
jgi:flagellar hook assembly protein FlgD